jgi:hypothetical protein
MTDIIEAYKLGSRQVLSVGKAPGHKPTTFEVARDKSGRRDKDCLYPNCGIPDQTNLFLSSYHPLLLVWKILALNQL